MSVWSRCDRGIRMKNSKKGFTLVEFIIVIVITGIIAGILAILIGEVTKTYTFIRVRGTGLSDSRLAIDRMVREIRQVAGITSIYSATPESLRFGNVNSEDITLEKAGASLLRNSDELADSVESLKFEYRDRDNVVLTDTNIVVNDLSTPAEEETNIWRILITLTIKRANERVKFQDQVHPRNL